jgi:CubicO group peptidase (beta-lactamase class C family)
VITIHQLLTHTAGFGSTYTGGGLLSRTSAVRAILSQPLTSPPGQRFLYGDDDYELLAAVIEVVTGRSWENTIQRRILDPIGLTQTGFWCGPWRNVPRPVAAADGTRTECAAGHADWGHKGANGMSATADDLLRWTSTLWHFGRGASRFSAITSSHIFVRREGSREVHYGYGVRLYYEKNKLVEIAHTGSGDDGHTAIVRQLASGLTIIVLSNAGQHGGTTWSSYVATRLAQYAH